MTDAIETQQPKLSAQPISPPTKPMQYRAIGLLKARYVPSAEEITKGILLTTDNAIIDAVVKGKLLSLVKNKLDLEKEHLWVVYPKTPSEASPIPLHVQLVGIWEPETLHPEIVETEELQYEADDFSIQGEVIYQNFELASVVVKVVQTPQKPEDIPKYFKLKLKGFLPPKSVKNFWEFSVRRVGTDLVIQSAENIASLGMKDKPRGKRPFNKNSKGYRPNSRPSSKPYPKNDSAPKPMPKKRPPQGSSGSE